MAKRVVVLALSAVLPVLPFAAAASSLSSVASDAAPTEPCLLVDFREITYFRGRHVLMSSDATIRARNGIVGDFDPSVWPYDPRGGLHHTRSRGTEFRIYGFAADQLGMPIPNAETGLEYAVQYDADTDGYYIDLGEPALVILCVSQLQTALVDHSSPHSPWVLPGTTVLTATQKNVPGIMLAHNAARINIPQRVREELWELGIPLLDAQGREVEQGIVDYVAVQLWGQGNAAFREFVDAEIRLIYDDPDDPLTHYRFGFHTANDINYESAAGCHYVDHAPGNDSFRMNDVWAGTHVGAQGWGPPCGAAEPWVNQKRRENYAVPFGGVQLLPTVNTHDDTIWIFFGQIRPPVVLGPPD